MQQRRERPKHSQSAPKDLVTYAIYRELDPFSANQLHIVKEKKPRKPMAVLEG